MGNTQFLSHMILHSIIRYMCSGTHLSSSASSSITPWRWMDGDGRAGFFGLSVLLCLWWRDISGNVSTQKRPWQGSWHMRYSWWPLVVEIKHVLLKSRTHIVTSSGVKAELANCNRWANAWHLAPSNSRCKSCCKDTGETRMLIS